MRRILQAMFVFAVTTAAVICTIPAKASSRVALVVGNAGYLHVATLKNPVRDAQLIADRLQSLGFEVIDASDVDKTSFERNLRTFASKAQDAEVAVFYYAGHGVQVDGHNWLIPVDAEISSKADLELSAVDLDTIMAEMQERAKISIVFLDACRDDPFKGLAQTPGKRSLAVGRGLAPIVSAQGEAFVAFAAQPGATASDGAGDHSYFASALNDALGTPGLGIEDMLKRVRVSVERATDNVQVPWDNSALSTAFYFAPAAAHSGATVGEAAPEIPASASRDLADEELQLWRSIVRSKDPQSFRGYLAKYPSGEFAEIAKAKIALLAPEVAKVNALADTKANAAEDAADAKERAHVKVLPTRAPDVVRAQTIMDQTAGVFTRVAPTAPKGREAAYAGVSYSLAEGYLDIGRSDQAIRYALAEAAAAENADNRPGQWNRVGFLKDAARTLLDAGDTSDGLKFARSALALWQEERPENAMSTMSASQALGLEYIFSKTGDVDTVKAIFAKSRLAYDQVKGGLLGSAFAPNFVTLPLMGIGQSGNFKTASELAGSLEPGLRPGAFGDIALTASKPDDTCNNQRGSDGSTPSASLPEILSELDEPNGLPQEITFLAHAAASCDQVELLSRIEILALQHADEADAKRNGPASFDQNDMNPYANSIAADWRLNHDQELSILSQLSIEISKKGDRTEAKQFVDSINARLRSAMLGSAQMSGDIHAPSQSDMLGDLVYLTGAYAELGAYSKARQTEKDALDLFDRASANNSLGIPQVINTSEGSLQLAKRQDLMLAIACTMADEGMYDDAGNMAAEAYKLIHAGDAADAGAISHVLARSDRFAEAQAAIALVQGASTQNNLRSQMAVEAARWNRADLVTQIMNAIPATDRSYYEGYASIAKLVAHGS